jgi:hypothetical protein
MFPGFTNSSYSWTEEKSRHTVDREVSIGASGHRSSKFQVQSSKRQVVLSTLNLELLTEAQVHCPRPERLAPRLLFQESSGLRARKVLVSRKPAVGESLL